MPMFVKIETQYNQESRCWKIKIVYSGVFLWPIYNIFDGEWQQKKADRIFKRFFRYGFDMSFDWYSDCMCVGFIVYRRGFGSISLILLNTHW